MFFLGKKLETNIYEICDKGNFGLSFHQMSKRPAMLLFLTSCLIFQNTPAELLMK